MSIPNHLVSAKIAEARARGALNRPDTDEARALAEMERLLSEIPYARGLESVRLRTELHFQERMLAHILERTGQSLLADVLWDAAPTYDAFC